MMSCHIGNISISDHAAVFAEYSFGNQNTKSNSWRFRPFILADHNFISYFTEEFNSFMSINSASTEGPSLLWKTAKAFSRGLIIAYTLSKMRRQAKQKEILESKLKDAERLYIKKPTPGKMKEISTLRSALDSLLTKQAEVKICFAKQKILEHGDKVGKYLAYLTKKKSDSQCILSIVDSSGKHFLDSLSVNNTFKEWFGNLYKSELEGDTTQSTELFFSTLNLPTLSEDQTSFLNAPISKKEVLEAIKSLQSWKAPGPDGLSREFSKEFRDLLVDPLLNMFNDSFVKGHLPQSLREANISLILKKAKQAEDCL